MAIDCITHQFGPWSPMRFIPVPTFGGPDTEPAFWITTSRICHGMHDYLCAEAQTQTFGPLVLKGAAPADVWQCPNCNRQQPPTEPAVTGQPPVCLFCSDSATVQHAGDSRDTVAAVSSVAALYTATTTLRQVSAAAGFVRSVDLLEGTEASLCILLEYAALAIKQDPARAAHTVNRITVQLARQVSGNAQRLIPAAREPFPVKENDEG